MKNFFPIETPYSSEDYKLMKSAINEDFKQSEFKKNPKSNNEFLWNIHESELPILYKRLEDLNEKTGNDDYLSLLEEIKFLIKKSTKPTEVAEMIDPYDPMDANQTITGEPAGNTDLSPSGVDTAPAYQTGPSAPANINKNVENTIDDDTKAQELAAESLGTLGLSYTNEDESDSLRNAHGMNVKPSNLQEEWGDRYENVMFAQGEDADEYLSILKNSGPEAALNAMTQGHYPGEHDASPELNHGSGDNTFEKDGYILSWNPRLNYIGLQFDTNHEKAMAEDSQMKRHLAGQREKIGNTPLGQHAPHSQAAKK